MVNAMVTFVTNVSFAFVNFVMRLIVINHPPNIKKKFSRRSCTLPVCFSQGEVFPLGERNPPSTPGVYIVISIISNWTGDWSWPILKNLKIFHICQTSIGARVRLRGGWRRAAKSRGGAKGQKTQAGKIKREWNSDQRGKRLFVLIAFKLGICSPRRCSIIFLERVISKVNFISLPYLDESKN